MKIIEIAKRMTAAARMERSAPRSIGFVPTLGFLHEGHEALIKKARKECDVVVVSRFVNPAQFRKKAYDAYPRDEKRDIAVCKRLKVDYLFSPSAEEMYPEGFDTMVEVRELAGKLEGASIRWHYRAVTTVVAKLFNIVQPNRAYFGKKDAHQLILIKRMTEDLNFPVKVVGVPTKRDRDGVALSSRNSLLNDEEREAAKVIPKAMREVETLVRSGATGKKRLTGRLIKIIESEPLAQVDFAAVVDADSLSAEKRGEKTLIYAAVYIGGKRLTDNLVVKT